VRELVASLSRAVEALLRVERGRMRSAGSRTAATLEALEAIRDAARPGAADAAGLQRVVDAIAAALEDEGAKRLRLWADGNLGANERAALGRDFAAFVAAAVDAAPRVLHARALLPLRLVRALRVLRPLWREAAQALRARGIASFEDLLRGARDLVRDHPRVASEIRRQLDQLLVDEFQDTDALQCELVGALAFAGDAAERPGLFVVGDPKQSIYGWRSADLGAYFDFQRRLLQAGGELRRLSVNFRSVPAILEEVERVIAPVMREEAGLQPRFEPLVACDENADEPGFREGDAAPVEHWIAWRRREHGEVAPTDTVAEAVEVEAAGVAADVRRLHDAHGVPFRDVALLLRTRGHLDTWLDALRAAGVPYAVEGDRTYYQRREVIDAAALVRCVLDRLDLLSLLAALRCSAVGVPDAALIPLWDARLPELAAALDGPASPALAGLRAAAATAVAALPHDTPGLARVAGWERALVHFFETLAVLRESFAQEAPDVFVEKLRTRLLFEVGEAARIQGSYRLANLERFFRGLARDLSDGAGGTQALLRQLRIRVEEALAAEEARPEGAVDDAVRVLTIHQAKGLDFPHVYVVGLGHLARGPVVASDPRVWIRGGRVALRLFEAPTLSWAEAEVERARLEQVEGVRTLYVAMTRAKRRLVLTASWKSPAAGGSHLELVGERDAIPDLARLAADLSGRGASFADAGAARWVFPALRPGVDAAEESEEAAAAAREAEARADARRLRTLAGEAQSRMARAHSAPASAESKAALRELLAAEAAPEARSGRPRRIALAVGSAVHAWLEHADFGGATASGDEALAALRKSVASGLAEDEAREALARAEEIAQRLQRGPLAARLAALRGRVVARELAFVAPPHDESGPVESTAGAIDLVYRDPADDRLVVADWKTDSVEGAALEARANAYAAQLRSYGHALRSGLGLDYLPRQEIWFLASERVVAVPG
jgi:ATP-dependent helicase/nuclease subunit A